MSFDLARTPTLEAVAEENEQVLARELQKRAEESIAAAEARAEVVEACEKQRKAEERLARLRRAERALSAYAKESRAQTAADEQTALDAMIESAGTKSRIDFRKSDGLAALEHQNRLASRAIEHLVEKLIPWAHIASLREESHALETRARAAEQIAQERAEKVLGALRDAVTEEMVLPVDLSKGVAGTLVAHAGGLRRCALQISESADAMERGLERVHQRRPAGTIGGVK
ncbi:MAG TPA: hypothetical protein VIX12_06115 [Candidatus Binataceae bacterium]